MAGRDPPAEMKRGWVEDDRSARGARLSGQHCVLCTHAFAGRDKERMREERCSLLVCGACGDVSRKLRPMGKCWNSQGSTAGRMDPCPFSLTSRGPCPY